MKYWGELKYALEIYNVYEAIDKRRPQNFTVSVPPCLQIFAFCSSICIRTWQTLTYVVAQG